MAIFPVSRGKKVTSALGSQGHSLKIIQVRNSPNKTERQTGAITRWLGSRCHKRAVLANVPLLPFAAKVHPPRAFALLKGSITCGRCPFTPVSALKVHLPEPLFWKLPFRDTPIVMLMPSWKAWNPKTIKVTQKWLKSDSGGSALKWFKNDSKWLKWIFESFLSHFKADPPVSLLSHFNCCRASGLPGGHQHHKTPIGVLWCQRWPYLSPQKHDIHKSILGKFRLGAEKRPGPVSKRF